MEETCATKDTGMHWTVHLEGGPRRVNHAAVTIGDKIYSFGGYCTGEDYETARPMDIHVLDTATYQWKRLPVPQEEEVQYYVTPYQRYGHTAVAYEDKAYIWGGRNDCDGASNTLHCYNPVTNLWNVVETGGTIPGARDGHSACVLHGKMFIFGGYEEDVDRFSNDVHCYEFKTNTWTLLNVRGVPARWRDFHSATGIKDTMYIFGGRSDRAGPFHTNHEIYCNEIQTFNTLTNTWHKPATTGDVPTPGRRSQTAFVYQDKLYIFGGYNGLQDKHFNEMFCYDPETSEWCRVYTQGKGPCARRRQCCCVAGNRLFLFGGTSPNPDLEDSSVYIHPAHTLLDHSDLHVLDFSPSLKTLSSLAVLKYKLDQTYLPRDIRWELTAMTTNSSITRPSNSNG